MDNNSFAVGYVLGWKRGSDSGGGSSIKDDTFDDIIANKQEIVTLWQDNTFKITLNVWYNEDVRGGTRDYSYISNQTTYTPKSSFYVWTQNWYAVVIVYKNNVPQYAAFLNSSYDNTDVPRPLFTYTKNMSAVSHDSTHIYWYQWAYADFSSTVWTADPVTAFEFPSSSGMWNGCMKFKTAYSARYTAYNRSLSWDGDTPVLSDWTGQAMTISSAHDWDYTRANAKQANIILPSYSRFTKLTHGDYQQLINELMYAVNTYLGINVEMPNIIS